jgi:tRNA pseudouridine55 synthase
VDGLLIIDKPGGWTSHDVVARVRRLIGQRRVGHAGTLDPLATGVLPVGLGQGTRVLEYVTAAGKAYRASVRLGVTTDTYDAEGQTTGSAPLGGLTASDIERALGPFRGAFEQRAPLFSAIKRQGRPLYSYARAGVAAEAPVRVVRVEALRLSGWDPPDVELDIECASGFYVRSLAHDLGQALGCGAHLRALRRTRVGAFEADEAIGLDFLAESVAGNRIGDCLWSLDAPLRDRPAVVLSGEHAAQLSNGRPWNPTAPSGVATAGVCRAYSADGELIALLELLPDGSARPLKVFPPGQRGLNGVEEYTPVVVIP